MPARTLLRDIMPPVLWRSAERIHRTVAARDDNGSKWAFGVEQPPEFYDHTFLNADHWHLHYTKSHYYPLWSVIRDRLLRANVRKILDIGCGPGQVAEMLRDNGVTEYVGIDFSPARVDHAQRLCPEFRFLIADVFEGDVLRAIDYDCVLLLEFLEHVEEDLAVIERIRKGTFVLATVPNFESHGHVRYFEDTDEVERRYRGVFQTLRVDRHLSNNNGRTYYILDGVR